jgi:hypothetical protein
MSAMIREKTQSIGRVFLLIALMPVLSGCIITPRVEMTERIDFNYHAPAIAQPMNFEDQMCAA